ncbi:6775_t:CDS:2 [Entrophospora sp. SA101]|nr:6775_t:CDS:2 [Entrophospora sp. SA101]
MSYDLIIIGAGPAGLTAGIYAKRALLKCLILEKSLSGGKLNKTADVDNYPGFTSIKGPELAEEMTKHANHYKIDWKKEEEVVKLEQKENKFIVKTNKSSTFISKTIIIASGAIENELKIKGEREFTNLGVSYCAICDGFAFQGEKVAVVGGGYSALETALYMSNIASQVYLIHRRSEFRAEKEIVAKAKNNPKITFLLDSILTEIQGDEEVKKVIINNLTDKQKSVCDSENYIAIKDDCSTAVPGLFAAGDVARINKDKIKQVVTAVAEGAIAAQSVINSGKLINFSITDFGEKIQKAKISFGQVPLGIYRKGPKKKRKPIFHDEEKEKELHQLAINLTQKSSFYASLRNFQQKTSMNFTQADFDRAKYNHEVCGLGRYNDRVSYLKISDQPIKSAEGIITYLTKYLVKSFQMRANKELAAKVGLLPNMRIYKFFQTTYGYYKGKRYHQGEKIRKPDYYTHSSTMTMVTPNKKISTENLAIPVRIPLESKDKFKGPTAYTIFRDFIHPALRLLNLPNFQKFSNYQIRAGDYEKFAHQAKLPWNKEINKYALGEEAGESIKSPA